MSVPYVPTSEQGERDDAEAIRSVPVADEKGAVAAPGETDVTGTVATEETDVTGAVVTEETDTTEAVADPELPVVHDDEDLSPTQKFIRKAVKFAPFIGLALSIAIVAWGWHTGVLKSLDSLRAFIASLGFWGPIGFMIASFASVMFPIIPGGILVLAAPIMFGPVEGTIYSWISVCAGSLVNFIVARQVGMPLIEAMFKRDTVEKYLGWTRKPGFTTAFATAIVLPVAPDDLLCYLAGTTKMKFSTYAWIILLGKIPSLLAYGLGVSTLIMHFLPWSK